MSVDSSILETKISPSPFGPVQAVFTILDNHILQLSMSWQHTTPMTISKRIITVTIIAALASMLLIPLLASTNGPAIAAVFDPHKAIPRAIPAAGDTIGDISIRATFYFHKATETVDSFRVFNTLGGYDFATNPKLELTGGVGSDKSILYFVTDNAHHIRHNKALPEFTDFDIDVHLMKGEDAYRKFSYSSCHVTDYNVLTLYDGDETFSGKTKFVVADQFLFDCQSFHPHCPYCEKTIEEASKVERSIPYEHGEEQQFDSWEEFWGTRQQAP